MTRVEKFMKLYLPDYQYVANELERNDGYCMLDIEYLKTALTMILQEDFGFDESYVQFMENDISKFLELEEVDTAVNAMLGVCTYLDIVEPKEY